MTDLQALLTRVEEATGGDRELDAAIECAFNWTAENTDADLLRMVQAGEPLAAVALVDPDWRLHEWVSPVTSSLDAALALVERALPGSMWQVGFDPDDGSMCARIVTAAPLCAHAKANHDTAALAICAAALRALIAQQSAEPSRPQPLSGRPRADSSTTTEGR